MRLERTNSLISASNTTSELKANQGSAATASKSGLFNFDVEDSIPASNTASELRNFHRHLLCKKHRIVLPSDETKIKINVQRYEQYDYCEVFTLMDLGKKSTTTVADLLDSMEVPEQTVFDNQKSLENKYLQLLSDEQFYNDIRKFFHPEITYEEVCFISGGIYGLINSKKKVDVKKLNRAIDKFREMLVNGGKYGNEMIKELAMEIYRCSYHIKINTDLT